MHAMKKVGKWSMHNIRPYAVYAYSILSYVPYIHNCLIATVSKCVPLSVELSEMYLAKQAMQCIIFRHSENVSNAHVTSEVQHIRT